ncbi:MAG: hypothetical protein H5T61_06355 [Thermoflexales bacterium]|nr:hypothetical protein [Thermoflexales bacterium]
MSQREREYRRLLEQLECRLRAAGRALRDVLYGMTLYDWVLELQKARGEVEQAFTLLVFGDLLGIPILTPYYTLRLIPYMVPRIEAWRRSMLRERDICELFDQEIG